MAKRKSSIQSTVSTVSTVSYKKRKLNDPDAILNSAHYIGSTPSFISLPIAPETFKKRKRSNNLEAEFESIQEPKEKRIKTSDSQSDQRRYSRSLSPASAWSILSDLSEAEDEGLDPEVEAFRKAHWKAMAEDSPSQPLVRPNPLPSPEPSDRDRTESDGTESDGTESDGTESDGTESDELGLPIITSTPEPSILFPRQRPRSRDTMPPYGKRRQPPKKGKDEMERNKRRNTAFQHTVEEISHSKRSSRRDHNCKLWQLGDDGTAHEVSTAR